MIVISGHRVEAGCSVLKGAKSKEPPGVGKKPARSGMLDDGGFAACEIAERAIADPCVLKTEARRLCATEFTQRLLDIALVILGSRRHRRRPTDAPAICTEGVFFHRG